MVWSPQTISLVTRIGYPLYPGAMLSSVRRRCRDGTIISALHLATRWEYPAPRGARLEQHRFLWSSCATVQTRHFHAHAALDHRRPLVSWRSQPGARSDEEAL